MPAPSRAHLLLPSPQGLLHYDLVEETAFVGPGPRGGLTADPAFFAGAKAAVREDGGGWIVRPLPGEPPPEVNGAAATDARLRDGDRIRLGDQVALFRASAGAALLAPSVAVPPAAASPASPSLSPEAAAPRTKRGPVRVEAPPSATAAARTLILIGLGLVLFAAYRAVKLLETAPPPATAVVTESMKAAPDVVVPRTEQQAAQAWKDAQQFETEHGGDIEGCVVRYLAVVRNHKDSAAARRAAARVGELWPRHAERSWQKLEVSLKAQENLGKYRTALAAVDDFDSKFSGTEAAAAAQAARERLRTGARAALDGLRQRVAPLIAVDPNRAYRALTMSGLELPADLEAELYALIVHVRAQLPSRAGPPDPTTGRPGPGNPTGHLTPPTKPPGETPTPAPTPGSEREEAAKTTWVAARTALLGGKWADAKKGYVALLKDFKDTAVVAGAIDRVRAGKQAADAGQRGAAALLTGQGDWKDGRLTIEYTFDYDTAFRTDFDLVQPFAGEEPTQAECRDGLAILSGSTAMLLKVVFDPNDVAWEMDCVADEPHDFGLIGVQEGKEYRTVAMHVGNTQFKLKKGAAATVLAGHVLWLFGDGVWKDADPGERGFVRIGEHKGNQLKADEKIKVRTELKAGQVSGEIQAKSDHVELKGPLKGDDGKGIGTLKVGPFAYRGRVGVQRLWISGKVDEAWLKRTIEALIASETGPS